MIIIIIITIIINITIIIIIMIIIIIISVSYVLVSWLSHTVSVTTQGVSRETSSNLCSFTA